MPQQLLGLHDDVLAVTATLQDAVTATLQDTEYASATMSHVTSLSTKSWPAMR